MPRLGWREWLALPELKLRAIRAKIDTGARSSALHVEESETFFENGIEWVRFAIVPTRGGKVRECRARVVDHREVTDSGGKRTLRVFIQTTLALGGQRYPIELNLTQRREMLFPMLLGRTAVAGRWVVDPSGSFLLGEKPARRTATAADGIVKPD
ncbi:ATP-dependent zinc protease family protein [Pseudomarimonas salicorniae]|uniref:RimK/LysX family protein n=1 Tax=Pseudomarimonas salicorniae TaxID=2933270 RepID=A0ABT0GM46_9GAMM|nr:RimK/LysX family protein [Lysobacter sp. CAU 1642]MCK7595498.1 RimK/LysX family protein [Lysobacter sp. CAU 1642]